MLSILSGILGIVTSGLPSVLDFFKQKGDQKHEREMAALQTERELALAKEGLASQERIEDIKADQVEMETYTREREALYEHDKKMMEKSAQWIVNMNAAVRPIVAFTFVFLLVFIDIAGLVWAMKTGVEFGIAIDAVFSDDEMAIVSSIVGFYFGSRSWEKRKK